MIDRLKFYFLRIFSVKLFNREERAATLCDATIDGEWGFIRNRSGRLISDGWGSDDRGLRFIFRRLVRERATSRYFRYVLGWRGSNAKAHLPKAIYMVPSSGLTLEAPNYFHWLLETLPGIMLYLHDDSLHDFKIVLRRKSPRWIYESLSIFGIHPEQTIETSDQGEISVDYLVVPKVFWISAFYLPDSPALLKLREQVLSRPAPVATELVYFARGEDDRRKPENHIEIENLIIALGGSVYSPEELTVSQQKAICSETHTLVLPAGASLANAIWMSTGANIVVLQARDDIRATFMPKLAELCKLRLFIVGSVPGTQGSGRHDNYVTNLSELAAILKDARNTRDFPTLKEAP